MWLQPYNTQDMTKLVTRSAYGGVCHVIISILICGKIYTYTMDNDNVFKINYYASFVRLWYRVQVDILMIFITKSSIYLNRKTYINGI